MELRNRLSVAVATAIGRSKRTRFDTHPCRLEHDPDAYWDPSTKTIKNGCVETLSCYRYVNGSTTVADPNATVSPRVVPLARLRSAAPVPDRADQDGQYSRILPRADAGQGSERHPGQQPGLLISGSGSVSPSAAFTTVTLLVR